MRQREDQQTNAGRRLSQAPFEIWAIGTAGDVRWEGADFPLTSEQERAVDALRRAYQDFRAAVHACGEDFSNVRLGNDPSGKIEIPERLGRLAQTISATTQADVRLRATGIRLEVDTSAADREELPAWTEIHLRRGHLRD